MSNSFCDVWCPNAEQWQNEKKQTEKLIRTLPVFTQYATRNTAVPLYTFIWASYSGRTSEEIAIDMAWHGNGNCQLAMTKSGKNKKNKKNSMMLWVSWLLKDGYYVLLYMNEYTCYLLLDFSPFIFWMISLP